MTMARPAYAITTSSPGSELAGETAAAMAAASILFKTANPGIIFKRAFSNIDSESSMHSKWNSLSVLLVDTATDKCEFVTKPLEEVRKEAGGIEAAKNAPVRYPNKRSDIRSLGEAFQRAK